MSTTPERRTLLSIKRRQSLMPQQAVAAKLGISQGGYSNIENGYAKPGAEQAAALIEMFDLPHDYFDEKEGAKSGQE